MKNLRRLVLVLIALLAVLALVGCGGGDDNGDNNGSGNGNGTTNGDGNGDGNGNGDGDGDGDGETAQWAGYNFGVTVKPSSGASGQVKTFKYEFGYKDDEGLREFDVDGTYLGRVNEPILTQKMTYSTTTHEFTYENVTTMMDCYKLKHRVTVVTNQTDEEYPEWSETTIWIPVDVPEDSAMGTWIYPKAEYRDSEGDEGMWSYWLTEAMQNEADNAASGVSYIHAWEGEVFEQGFFDWTYIGLYGWGWSWFKDFAEGGEQELKAGSWGSSGYSYECQKVKKTVGAYTLDAWSLEFSITYGGDSGGYKGIFSQDLAMPLYWKFGSSSGGDDTYWEYEMTDLVLG